jgi:hypothetical protein
MSRPSCACISDRHKYCTNLLGLPEFSSYPLLFVPCTLDISTVYHTLRIQQSYTAFHYSAAGPLRVGRGGAKGKISPGPQLKWASTKSPNEIRRKYELKYPSIVDNFPFLRPQNRGRFSCL